jgi:hypothetical protein
MGPNYLSGKTRIGRQRLPSGLVAILDDPKTLRGALLELYAYAMDVRTPDRPRRGIVYRVVPDEERLGIRYKLQKLVGMKRFLLSKFRRSPVKLTSLIGYGTVLWETGRCGSRQRQLRQ